MTQRNRRFRSTLATAALGASVLAVTMNAEAQQPLDTNGFEQDEQKFFEQGAIDGKKLFYETAKFNPRELLDMVDLSVSSSKDAEEEAHLPTINLFR